MKMIADDIRYKLQIVEKLTQDLGDVITHEDYVVEDMGCPHKQSSWKKGYCAVYIFIYEYDDGTYEFLKIGKANAKSAARFVSQHYGFSAMSTLAKSVCADEEFKALGVSPENVKPWMLNNLHRINIYIDAKVGRAATELIEAVLHYAYRPRYEGNI